MQRNHLSTQEILSVGDAVGDLDGVDSGVVDDLGCAPGAVGIPVFLDLEPASARQQQLRLNAQGRYQTHHPFP